MNTTHEAPLTKNICKNFQEHVDFKKFWPVKKRIDDSAFQEEELL